jgi:hypothetical protein
VIPAQRLTLIRELVEQRRVDWASEIAEDIILAEIEENDRGAFHIRDVADDFDDN